MSYEITPIKFQNGAPTDSEIISFIADNSTQTVRIEKRESPGQLCIFLESYPNDVLELNRKGNTITISGNSSAAPALSKILYSTLVSLGGDGRSEISLVQFPVSNRYIHETNRKVRLSLYVFSTLVWAALLSVIAIAVGVIYYLIHHAFIA